MLQVLEQGAFAETIHRAQLLDPLGEIQLALFGTELLVRTRKGLHPIPARQYGLDCFRHCLGTAQSACSNRAGLSHGW
jgi:hypothetical protein